MLSGVRLAGAALAGSRWSRTVLARCGDLSRATGLDAVRSGAPSSIDLETLERNAGRIPPEFLLALGADAYSGSGSASPSLR